MIISKNNDEFFSISYNTSKSVDYYGQVKFPYKFKNTGFRGFCLFVDRNTENFDTYVMNLGTFNIYIILII